MNAMKFTVSIEAEVLSLDSVATLLIKVADQIANECPQGRLSFEDGDCIEWNTKLTAVGF